MSARGKEMSISSPATLICFNTECRDSKSLSRRNGWHLWSGEYAQLCDRCASMFEEGSFCDTFHLHDSGWRCCQSCGKRVHCGCIVSLNTYVVLDPGGVECIRCANKRSSLRCASPTWTSSPFAELSLRSSFQFSGSVGVHQHPKIPGFEEKKIIASDSFSVSQGHNIPSERGRPPNGCLHLNAVRLQEYGFNQGENQSSSFGMGLQPTFLKDRPNSAQCHFAMSSAMPGKCNSQARVITDDPKLNTLTGRPLCSVSQNLPDPPSETQLHRTKVEADPRSKNQLFSRYLPRISDQELQQLCGDSNSVITPLFEKMLSVSDAGRIGRLVLPKRCAETYFPTISEPEGLPLKIQDVKGREWIFQFRFWPNNNSRMYVLEGITPCIQSMELEAGDVVTFSRVDPEGKLVMGFRKASTSVLSTQTKPGKSCNGVSTHGESKIANSSKLGVAPDAKKSLSKRKNGAPGSKNKRAKIEAVDVVGLKLTMEGAQGLLRPPSNHLPNVVVIEGFEFEEYEDSPLVGRPTIVTKDSEGVNAQWTQCDECFKWRKIPFDVQLPPRWTCYENSWDSHRSACPMEQEITTEQLRDLLSSLSPPDSLKRLKEIDLDPGDSLEGFLAKQVVGGEEAQITTRHPRHRDGCSCIVCIQPRSGKGTKHDLACECNFCDTMRRRFRTMMLKKEKKQAEPEQSNMVNALQPPEEEVPALAAQSSLGEVEGTSSFSGSRTMNCGASEDISNRRLSSSSFLGQIDLNLQPERDEEISPRLSSGGPGAGGRNDKKWDKFSREQGVLNLVGEGVG